MLYLVLAAWLAGTIGTALAIRYADARALLDVPGDRRSHTIPTPRGGGVGIVAAVLLVALVLLARQVTGHGADFGLLLAFAAGLVVVAAIGWVDDHRPLPAATRLLVHAAASALLAGAMWAATAHPGLTVLAFAAPLVLTNVWNFMDGINGIAATQAVLVAVFLSLAARGPWGTLAAGVAAACWAFVPYNFPRARVFMGDVGSGALGFVMGALVALAAREGLIATGPAPLLLLTLPLAAFLVDAALTLARRILRGERWWTPHVQHAYQGAARRLGHGRVTMAFGVWTLMGCLIALWARSQSDFFILSSAAGWYTLTALLWWQVQRWSSTGQSVFRSRDSA